MAGPPGAPAGWAALGREDSKFTSHPPQRSVGRTEARGTGGSGQERLLEGVGTPRCPTRLAPGASEFTGSATRE